MTNTALVIVDVQNDFCEGGAMGVQGGAAVAASISKLVAAEAASGRWSHIVLTRDWHYEPGSHWAGPDETPNFIDTWPVHCQAETDGAAFHPSLQVNADETFSKGQYAACYSGFEGAADTDQTPLDSWLQERGITRVEVVGVATDHCVLATARDAVQAGFHTSVLVDHCVGVAADSTKAALTLMAEAGIELITTSI